VLDSDVTGAILVEMASNVADDENNSSAISTFD